MDLHRGQADAEFGGDHFVVLPDRHPFQDFSLARGQQGHAFRRRSAPNLTAPLQNIELQGLAHPRQQRLALKGFFDKIEGARLHGPDRHRHIAVAGHENDRSSVPLLLQLPLQIQAAHARHPHVQHQATGSPNGGGFEKDRRAGKGFHHQSGGLEQQADGVAHSLIVVDDKNGRGSIHAGGKGEPGLMWRGRVKWNEVPQSGFGVAHNRPLCDSMIERLTDRLRPMPPGLVLKKG